MEVAPRERGLALRFASASAGITNRALETNSLEFVYVLVLRPPLVVRPGCTPEERETVPRERILDQQERQRAATPNPALLEKLFPQEGHEITLRPSSEVEARHGQFLTAEAI